MLNNKYLAIVLSVIAVLVVVYQVFINKKKPQSRPGAQAGIQQPMPAAQSPQPNIQPGSQPPPGSAGLTTPGAATVPATNFSSTSQNMATQNMNTQNIHTQDDGLQIDYDSPLLLKRVYENPMEAYPKQELDNRFGKSIFTAPRIDETSMIKSAKGAEIRFHLNSINIDNNRRIAVINDTIVQSGDFISGAQVEEIQKSRVVLKFKDKSVVLTTTSRIKTINLVGGQGDR